MTTAPPAVHSETRSRSRPARDDDARGPALFRDPAGRLLAPHPAPPLPRRPPRRRARLPRRRIQQTPRSARPRPARMARPRRPAGRPRHGREGGVEGGVARDDAGARAAVPLGGVRAPRERLRRPTERPARGGIRARAPPRDPRDPRAVRRLRRKRVPVVPPRDARGGDPGPRPGVSRDRPAHGRRRAREQGRVGLRPTRPRVRRARSQGGVRSRRDVVVAAGRGVPREVHRARAPRPGATRHRQQRVARYRPHARRRGRLVRGRGGGGGGGGRESIVGFVPRDAPAFTFDGPNRRDERPGVPRDERRRVPVRVRDDAGGA